MSITSQTSNPNDNLSVVLLLYSSQHTWCSIHGVNGELTGFCGHFNGCDCHSCIGGEYVCSKNKLNGKNKQNEISRKEGTSYTFDNKTWDYIVQRLFGGFIFLARRFMIGGNLCVSERILCIYYNIIIANERKIFRHVNNNLK